ncbi:EAL domain-containing protein [Paraconexibacter sp.]|uniref:bifunctional diguanylate cyclase/phosphodiesterase n=1 Tax=Paraconexibacter sp. TaxID=2949640 RepID=UPI003561AEE5
MRHRGARPLLAVGVLLIGLLAAFGIALTGAQNTTREDVADRFVERVDLSAALTQSVFASSAESSEPVYAQRFGGRTVARGVLDEAARSGRSANVILLDASGAVLTASTNTSAGVLRMIRARPAWLVSVLRGRTFALSDVRRPPGGTPVIQWAQRFDTRHGTRVLVSGFRPSLLSKFFAGYLRQVNHRGGGKAYVLDSAGVIVGTTQRGAKSGLSTGPSALVEALGARTRGSFGNTYFASSPVAGSDWRVVLTAPADALFVSVTGQRKWLPWGIMAAFAIAGLLAVGFLRRGLRSAADLAQIQERYALAVQGSKDGIWDYDATTGELYLSPRWKEMLGLPDETGDPLSLWQASIHPEDRQLVVDAFDRHVDGLAPTIEVEHRMRHADGDYRWVLSRGLVIRDADGQPIRAAGSMSDITDRKRAEERLRRDALHDSLTGLANRALFLDRLGVAIRQTTRDPGRSCAVLFLDLDRFKLINDSFSHAVGDELLVEVGRRLSTLLRPGDTVARPLDGGDTVARLGGDEFTILLDDVRSPEAAVQVANRILDALAEPFHVKDRRVVVGASIGVALSGLGSTPAEMMRNADLAMYEAKRQGKSRVAVFTDHLHHYVTGRLDLEVQLRAILEERRLDVAYQPVMDLATGRLSGFEALARWPEDQAGNRPVTPDQFIPVAEESGLIAPLGRLVMETACTQLSRWRAAGLVDDHVTVSVNVSGVQFDEPGRLMDDVVSVLEQTGLPPAVLRLELTESTLSSDPDGLDATLKEFARLGVRSHIDDFGTGYSSLARLHEFAGDTVKIDRSFVSSMHTDDGHCEVVRAIVALAHNLGLRTVAEGIDDPRQLEMLQVLGCEHGQGFLLARPLPAQEVEGLLPVWGAAGGLVYS